MTTSILFSKLPRPSVTAPVEVEGQPCRVDCPYALPIGPLALHCTAETAGLTGRLAEREDRQAWSRKSEKPAQAGQPPVRYNLSRVTRTDPSTRVLVPPEAEPAKV